MCQEETGEKVLGVPGLIHANTHFDVSAVLLGNGNEFFLGVAVVMHHKRDTLIEKLSCVSQRNGMGVPIK